MNYTLAVQKADFGTITYMPGGTCGPRLQPHTQLVLLDKGDCHVRIDGTQHLLPAQHVALLHPGHHEFFQFSRKASTRHSWVHMRLGPMEPAMQVTLTSLPFCIALNSRLEKLQALGLSIQPCTEPLDVAQSVRIAECMLMEYIRIAEMAAHTGGRLEPVPEPVLLAQRHIEQHSEQDLNLDVLGKVSHVTPPHLIRLFRRHLGTTPIHYLWQVRLRHGVQLLRETGLRISEIAWRTGFKTPAHFSRAIQKEYQLAPRQLRARAWNQQE